MPLLSPDYENDRLTKLESLNILDTAAEQEFDDLVMLAAQICEAPISAICLVDDNRLWFKSKLGIETNQMPREAGFCAHTILGDGLFCVSNAAEDERFKTNPWVMSDPGIRFYAGVPLITAEGYALGSFCIFDKIPRQLRPEQEQALYALARQAMNLIGLRKDSVLLEQIDQQLKAREENYRIVSESASDVIITVDEDSRIVFANAAVEKVFGYLPEEMIGNQLEMIIPEHLRAAHRVGMQRYMQSSQKNIPWNGIALPAVRSDGEEIQTEISFGEYRLHDNRRFFTAVVRDITERKQIEAELQSSEKRYRFLAESVPQQVWTALPDGRINYGNHRTVEYFGKDLQEELFGANWTKILHPDDLDLTIERWTRAVKTGEHYETEYRLRRSDGEYRWHLAQASPMLDENGKIIKWFGTNTDIHNYRIAEEKSRKSAAYLNLFRHANDAILIFEPESEIILDASDKALQIYGRSREDFIGRSLKEMSQNASRGALELEKLLCDGVYEEFESVHLRGDGTPINLVINASVIEYQGQKAILTINRDVTHRRKMEEALREREEHFRLLVEGVEDYAIFMLDPQGFIISWNAGAERLKGYTAEEIIGRHFSCFYTEEDLARRHPESELQIAVRDGRYEEEGWRVHKNGSQFLANVLITTLRDEKGQLHGFSKITRDITDRRKAEDELKESRKRYQQLFDSNPHPIWVYDVETLDFLAVNNEAVERYGYSNNEFFKLSLKDIYPAAENSLLLEHINHVRQFDVPVTRITKHQKKDGSVVDVEVSSQPIIFAGRRARLVLSTDITMRKRAEEQLIHNALHDELTGLPNRALFLEHLRYRIDRKNRRANEKFAVLFLDFDHFKLINDSLGHMEGDNLLKLVAKRLSESLRPSDIVARLGGDEFIILLDDISVLNDVIQIVDRIQSELKMPFKLRDNDIFVSASIGIALSDSTYTKPETMLRDADTAMYRAKANGKAGYQVFNQAMHEQVSARLKLEIELRQAVEREEFCLYYQPIVNLQTGKITGFESLVRWRHPTRGIISPAEFILIAEETGIIIPLGLWVLRESCRQLRTWQNESLFGSELTMSVNLSCKQFKQKNLVEEIFKIISETEIAAKDLRLEVTESYLMEDTEAAIEIMKRLHLLGIKLSIDDFGTGYSSLSYLHRLPINYLKIDRSFVSQMQINTENLEIVRTIILLAKNLNLKLIAEGIETIEQAEYLKNLDCDFGQGYLYSKPFAAHAARILIEQNFSADTTSAELSQQNFDLINDAAH